MRWCFCCFVYNMTWHVYNKIHVLTWSLPTWFSCPWGKNAESVIKQKHFELSSLRSQLPPSSWYVNASAFSIKSRNLFCQAVKIIKSHKYNYFLVKYCYIKKLKTPNACLPACLCFSSLTQCKTDLGLVLVCVWLLCLRSHLALVATIQSDYLFS